MRTFLWKASLFPLRRTLRSTTDGRVLVQQMIGLRSCGWIWAPRTRVKYRSTASCPARTGKQRWDKHTRSPLWCIAQMWSDHSLASTESRTFLWLPFLRTLPETDHHSYRRWVPLSHSKRRLETLSFPGETLQHAELCLSRSKRWPQEAGLRSKHTPDGTVNRSWSI